MSTPTIKRPAVELDLESASIRAVLWFAGHMTLAGLACAGLLLVGIAYGVSPNGFTATVALLLAAIAASGIAGAWGHRSAFLADINR